MNDLARIEQAIGFIPAIDRSVWVEVGMAVKSEFGDVGFPIWDAWSQQADSYKPESAKAVWKSIRESGKVTVATLYHHRPKRKESEILHTENESLFPLRQKTRLYADVWYLQNLLQRNGNARSDPRRQESFLVTCTTTSSRKSETA
jgi:hypothetical protein